MSRTVKEINPYIESNVTTELTYYGEQKLYLYIFKNNIKIN